MDARSKMKKRRLEEEQRREQELPVLTTRGPDLLSRLPDDILDSIITLLPAKDSARTQILSRRWRTFWRNAPLNLEANISYKNLNKDAHMASICSLLSRHEGPLRRFSLTCQLAGNDFQLVDTLMQSPRINDFLELEICSYSLLPPSLLRLLPAVRALHLYKRTAFSQDLIFPDLNQLTLPNCSLNFPNLKHLTLAKVHISGTALHAVLLGCPVLESLVLDGNIGCHRLQISSLNLRSLGVSVGVVLGEKLQELIVEDAPLLETFIPQPPTYGLVIRVIHAPKLKTLGYLHDDIPIFQLGTMLFEVQLHLSLSPMHFLLSVYCRPSPDHMVYVHIPYFRKWCLLLACPMRCAL